MSTSASTTTALDRARNEHVLQEDRKRRRKTWFDRAYPGYGFAALASYWGFSAGLTTGLWVGGISLAAATVLAFVLQLRADD